MSTKTRRYGVWAGNEKGVAEDTTLCIEEVQGSGKGGMFYQCNRKRGYGRDGLYCGQHALRHPADGEIYPTRFMVELRYDRPNISIVRIIKETENNVTLREDRNIIGSIYPSHSPIQKSKVHLFDTMEEARDYLFQRLIERSVELSNESNQLAKMAEEITHVTFRPS